MRLRNSRRGRGCLVRRRWVYSPLDARRPHCAALVALTIVSTPANAQSTTDSTTTVAPAGDAPLPYWAHGLTRPFIAGQVLAGLGIGRLSLKAGYGKPHFMWGGLEGNGSLTPYYTNLQGGLHISAFIADLYISYRRTYSLIHGILPNARSVSEDDLNASSKNKVQYNALDAEMRGFIPYGQLLLAWDFACVRPLNQPSKTLLFEELQSVVVAPPGVFSIKATPMVKPSRSLNLYVGVLIEQLALLGRGVAWVWRLGPSCFVTLSDHWNAGGFLSRPVQSPDRLGFWNSMYGTAALQYSFATGDN